MAKSTSKLFTDEQTLEGNMNLPEEDVQKEEVVEKATKKKKSVPVVKEEVAEDTEADVISEDGIQDIDMSEIARTPFRIDGDNRKIIHLNTSDLGVGHRLTVAYAKLNDLMDEITAKIDELPNTSDDMGDDEFKQVVDAIDDIDRKMGDQLNYLFNSDEIYRVFKMDGSMWDPINGYFRYEYIIDKLARLYETNLSSEIAKMRKRVSNKTQKYTQFKSMRR